MILSLGLLALGCGDDGEPNPPADDGGDVTSTNEDGGPKEDVAPPKPDIEPTVDDDVAQADMGPEDDVPVVPDDVPVVPDDVPVVTDDVPTTDADVTVVPDDVDTTDADVVVVTDDVPVTTDDVPVVTDDVPVVQEDGPVVQEDGPVVQEDGPVVQTDGPVVQEDVPVVQEDGPVVQTDVLTPDAPAGECQASDDCPGDQVCNTESFTCQDAVVQCENAAGCPDNGWTCTAGYCDYSAWVCTQTACNLVAPCVTDDDCPGGADLYYGWGSICHPDIHACVGCVDDEDCPGNMQCVQIAPGEPMLTCIEPPSNMPPSPCQTDDDCLGSRTCNAGACVDPACDDDRFEDNDTRATAVAIQAAYHSNLMLCSTDVDWFSITVPAGHILRVDGAFDQDLLDLDLYLCDPAAPCNPGYALYLLASELNPNHEWLLQAPQEEEMTYQILVSAYGAGDGWPATGPYDLSVSIYEAECMDDTECPGERNLCQSYACTMVECIEDDHCPGRLNLCRNNACTIVDCLDETDCDGFICNANVCTDWECINSGDCGGFLCQNHACTDIPVAANDTCATPTAINPGDSLQTNLEGVMNDYTGSCGGNGPEVVYELILAATTNIHLDTNGSAFDTVLYVSSGDCEGGVEVDCDDDGGNGTASALDLNLEAGTYYIFVDAYSATATGALFLNAVAMECVDDDGCPGELNICQNFTCIMVECTNNDHCPGDLNICLENVCTVVECLTSADCGGFLCQNHVCSTTPDPAIASCEDNVLPLDLSSGEATVSGTLSGPSGLSSCQDNGTGAEQVYLLEITDVPALMEVSVDGSANTLPSLRTDCLNAATERECYWYNGFNAYITEAGQYYLVLDSESGQTLYTMNVRLTQAGAAPDNDACDGEAVSVGTEPVVVTGNTLGAADDFHSPANCGAGSPAPDVVYAVTFEEELAAAHITMNFLDTVSYKVASLHIYTACGDEGTLVACDAGREVTGHDFYNGRVTLADIAAGTTLYFVADGASGDYGGFFNTGYVGDFQLIINPVVNNICGQAYPLQEGLNYGDTNGATNDYDIMDCVGTPAATSGGDVVYSADLLAGERAYVVLYPENFVGAMAVVTDCADMGGTCVVGEFTPPASSPVELDFAAPADGTYYFIVDAVTGGIFMLDAHLGVDCITTEDCDGIALCQDYACVTVECRNNADCEGELNICQPDNTCLLVECLNDDHCEGELNICQPDHTCLEVECLNDDHCDGRLNLCQPNHTCLMVECIDSTDCGGFLCRNHACTDISVPENDTCAGAIDVSAGGAFEGVIDAAAADYSGSCGGNGPDVVYFFTLDAETLVHLDTNGTAYDTVLYVRSGECEGDVQVECDDDDGDGTQSLIEATMLAGTYYVFVDAYSATATGSYILNVTLGE